MHHPQAASRKSVAQSAAEILARLRVRRPRVHCITNTVAQNFTANALLAAGCVPSMTVSVEEVGSFVSGAQGLLVNLGTFDKERARGDSDRRGCCAIDCVAVGARSRIRRPCSDARCIRP